MGWITLVEIQFAARKSPRNTMFFLERSFAKTDESGSLERSRGSCPETAGGIAQGWIEGVQLPADLTGLILQQLDH